MSEMTRKVPENFHALYDRPARAARGVTVVASEPAHAAVARMANDVSDLAIEFDEATHNPVQVTTRQAAGRLSARVADSPETAARQFVRDRADLWRLNDQDLGTLEVVSVSKQGLPTVRMLQRVDGVEVFQSACGPRRRPTPGLPCRFRSTRSTATTSRSFGMACRRC